VGENLFGHPSENKHADSATKEQIFNIELINASAVL
jgi:hypothetical protein